MKKHKVLLFALVFSVNCIWLPASNVQGKESKVTMTGTQLQEQQTSKAHFINFNKPLYLSDPTLASFTDGVTGEGQIKWTENTKDASFDAKVSVTQKSGTITYEFKLVLAESCTDSEIDGTFDVLKNGEVAASAIKGRLYGLNSKVSDYFKFYSEGQGWHLSAYVSDRDEITKDDTKNDFAYNKLSFENVEVDKIPEALKSKIEVAKENRGFLSHEDSGYFYIAAMGGTKPTAGYDIKVLSVEDSEGRVNVNVEEIAPAEADKQAQVITTPYSVIKIKAAGYKLTVTNTKGEQLPDNNSGTVVIYPNKDKVWTDMKSYTDVAADKVWTVKLKSQLKKELSTKVDIKDLIYVLDSKGNKVSVNLEISSDKKSITVTPDQKYESGQTYYLYIQNKNPKAAANVPDGFRMQFTIKN